MRPRILVVEDAGAVRDIMRDALGVAGFDVDTAATAGAALDCLAARHYALVLADCFLPDLPPPDWLAAVSAIAPDTPLVLVTGSIHLEELQRLAEEGGAVAVLAKPFAPRDLVEFVQRLLAPQPGYLFDSLQADQQRLIQSAESLAGFTAEACRRAGLRSGDRAIDIGCGPLGALPALAELVGAEGQVVGLEVSGEAVARAREILGQQGWTTVTLVQAELDTVAREALCPPGPFHLAYVRRFLVHQPDPANSLRRIASLLRSGGRIVAHEIPPDSGYPALTPAIPAIRRVDELVHAGVRARGGTPDAAHRFPDLCRAAGLRLVSQRGFVPAVEPVALLETFQAVLSSLTAAVISEGVGTEDEVKALLDQLERAKSGEYVSAFANLYIEMIAEVG